MKKLFVCTFILLNLLGIAYSQNLNKMREQDNSALVSAIKEGDIDSAKNLVADADLFVKDRAYLAAAEQCNTEIADVLLENGADPNEISIYDVKIRGLEYIFINTPKQEAKTAALIAIQEGCDEDVIKYFLSNGDIGQHLSYAVVGGDIDVTTKILDLYDSDISLDCNYSKSVLEGAAKYDLDNSTTEMFDMVNSKAEIDMGCGFSQIMLSRQFKEVKDELEYIAAKDDMDINCKFRDTYLTGWIIYQSGIKVAEKNAQLKLMVENIKELSAKDDEGNTALLRHMDEDNASFILSLIPGNRNDKEKEKYLNAKNKEGKTACEIERERDTPREQVIAQVCPSDKEVIEEISRGLSN